MQSILIEERIEELDKNKDGKVNLEEYIGIVCMCHLWNSKSECFCTSTGVQTIFGMVRKRLRNQTG